VSLRPGEQKESLGRAEAELRRKTSAETKRPAVVPASAQFAIHVASVVASATFPVVGLAHTVIVGGSVSRRDEIGGSKHQAQDGQDGECDPIHGSSLSSMSAQWRLGLFLCQPLRASADGWENGRRMGVWR
jgi:hypothetical protein